MNNKNSSKAGFTLIEILIAVLIIGVLTTIALPMYQGAVDKSKWARLIAPARAVSTAQEAAYMNQGGYTANIDDLDVSLPEGNDMTYTLYTTANGDDANFIRITSTQLDDVRLAKYYKNNEGFEDQLYCEAKNGNDRANKLCGKLLKGQELISTDDDYKMYLIEERANEVLCNRMNLWWSKNLTNCYRTEESRCTALGMPYGTFCGYTDDQQVTINEGGSCIATRSKGCKGATINEGGVCSSTGTTIIQGCNNVIINSGGRCEGTWASRACEHAIINEGGVCEGDCEYSTINNGGICQNGSCKHSIINDGGVCVATGTHGCSGDGTTINDGGICLAQAYQSCWKSTVNDGGVCYSLNGATCNLQVTYNGTGCCCGTRGCDASHACSSEKCAAVEEKLTTMGLL